MNVIDRFYKASLHLIPMTRARLFMARILYILLYGVLRKDIHRIRRKGVFYEVDLSEGIDLSLFLFGHFQDHITNNKLLSFPEDAVIFDIGANIGSMALRFAKLSPHGHVFAFEPTVYAFNKLRRNLALNPELAERITPVQCFVSDQTRPDSQIKAYSSWKIDGGILKAAGSTLAVSIDDFCLQHDIQKIDLIKIDTDGHELSVLRGARETLRKNHPSLIFEIGLYVLQEQKIRFESYDNILSAAGYRMFNSKNGREVTLENYSWQIPLRSTIDIVALVQKG
jgi:FkbM family methyltransferase